MKTLIYVQQLLNLVLDFAFAIQDITHKLYRHALIILILLVVNALNVMMIVNYVQKALPTLSVIYVK